MRIIYLKKLIRFANEHANCRSYLVLFKTIVEKAQWKNRQDILSDFPKSKMISANLVRFEILHNKFRLVAYINFDDQLVEIRFIGTHNEYNEIDPNSV
jgi:mRNA interferase HigB